MTDNRVHPRILPPPLLYTIKGAVIRFRPCGRTVAHEEIELSVAPHHARMPRLSPRQTVPHSWFLQSRKPLQLRRGFLRASCTR